MSAPRANDHAPKDVGASNSIGRNAAKKLPRENEREDVGRDATSVTLVNRSFAVSREGILSPRRQRANYLSRPSRPERTTPMCRGYFYGGDVEREIKRERGVEP